MVANTHHQPFMFLAMPNGMKFYSQFYFNSIPILRYECFFWRISARVNGNFFVFDWNGFRVSFFYNTTYLLELLIDQLEKSCQLKSVIRSYIYLKRERDNVCKKSGFMVSSEFFYGPGWLWWRSLRQQQQQQLVILQFNISLINSHGGRV